MSSNWALLQKQLLLKSNANPKHKKKTRSTAQPRTNGGGTTSKTHKRKGEAQELAPRAPKKLKQLQKPQQPIHKTAGASMVTGPPSEKTDLWDPYRHNDALDGIRPALAQRNSSLTPSSSAAIVRATIVLGEVFQELCGKKLGGRKWFAHFEQWLWSRRGAEITETEAVAVLPSGPAVTQDEELEAKLVKAGVSKTDAVTLCRRLGEKSIQLSRDVRSKIPKGLTSPKVTQKVLEGSNVVLSCNGVDLPVSRSHLAKLKVLYARRDHADGDMEEPSEFLSAAFNVLARYYALQGANARNGGMQAALHPGVFDVLAVEFGCCAECFASPLNCRWDRFCSASLDVDQPFGSLGSFFAFKPRQGSFEANPPFDAATVFKMLTHMEHLLSVSNGKEPLSFIVIIPYWPEKPCWKGLEGSAACRKVLHLKREDHGYTEGGQHYRPARYRLSNHDTSVFFLQNDEGAKRWPCTSAKEAKLRQAFRPLHNAQCVPTRPQ